MSGAESDIRQKVARSSLGTPGAVAARRSVTETQASRVVARSQALRQAAQSGSKRLGGNR